MKNSILTSSATETPTETRDLPLETTTSSPTLIPTSPKVPKLSAKFWALSLLLLSAIVLVFLHYRGTAASTSGGTGTVTAARKDFVDTLRLTGTTEAVRARPVLVPTLEGVSLNSLVVTRLTPAGTRVKEGDILTEFDPQAQMKDYLDKKATYQDLVDQVIVKQSAEAAARAKDETELKQGEDALAKAQLEASKSEIVSRIDAEKNQEALEEAQATLKQLQETFKLKRQSAAADIHTVEIQRDRAKTTMLYSQSNAQKMVIKSPMDGVVVLNMTWLGGQMREVREGDQVQPGVPFMKVIDPSEMEVMASVNEADLLKLNVGQQARISLDAYPGLSFPATLVELSPLGRMGQFSAKVRTFSALFIIHGSDPRLMPDLSAATDVDLADVKNATVIPIQSLDDDKGQDYVWLQRGAPFEKHAVKIGARNDMEAVVESGLRPGEVIRTDAPTAARGGGTN